MSIQERNKTADPDEKYIDAKALRLARSVGRHWAAKTASPEQLRKLDDLRKNLFLSHAMSWGNYFRDREDRTAYQVFAIDVLGHVDGDDYLSSWRDVVAHPDYRLMYEHKLEDPESFRNSVDEALVDANCVRAFAEAALGVWDLIKHRLGKDASRVADQAA